MKSTAKTITTLSLIILFLASALLIVGFIFTSVWLHTYNVFTNKTPIAEITIGEQQQDEYGPYTEVTITQYDTQSALAALFVKQDPDEDMEGETETFKLYGDEISIDGPVLKLKNGLLFINLDNIYKIGRVRSEYNDPDIEDNRDIENMPRRYDLNGGFADWREVNDTFESSSPLGWFYRLFIESSTIQSAGKFQPREETTYTLYVNTNGFTLEEE